MSCDRYREALSARLDGERAGLPAAELDAHLAGCPDCVAWQDAAARATRLVRLALAPAVPDLSAAVLAGVPVPEPAVRFRGVPRDLVGALLRAGLVLVAIGQAAVGWPALALGEETMGAPLHVAHESGAWNLALAVALLAVARRPRYASGLVPLLGAFVGVLAIFSVPDIVAGHVPFARLADHLLLVGGLVMVAALVHHSRGPATGPLGGRGLSGSDSGGGSTAEEPAPARPRLAGGAQAMAGGVAGGDVQAGGDERVVA
jgi:predicted anti-sigma-YlaC factor YlaD